MNNNVIDVKRLPGRSLLVTYEKGGTVEDSNFRPWIYASVPNDIRRGKRGDMVEKKCFWNDEKVKTVELFLNHPREIESLKKEVDVPIFEFDIDYLLRYVWGKHSEPPKEINAVVYDIEADPDTDEFLTSAVSFGKITFEDTCDVFFSEPFSVEDPEELCDMLNKADSVFGHNFLWYDNEIMAEYGLDRHIQRMTNPIYGNLEKAHLVSSALNIDTMQLANRFISRPPSLKLKVLAGHLGLGNPMFMTTKEITNSSIDELNEYCRNDVKLTAGIVERFLPQLWTVWDVLRIPPTVYLRFEGAGTYDINATLFYNRKGDEYYLPAKERNVGFEGEYGNPFASKHYGKKMPGPIIVKPEETGHDYETIEDVIQADFSGMFPNILLENDVSPEKVYKDENGEHEVIIEDVESGEKEWVSVRIEEDGFHPNIMEDLIEEVQYYKEKMKEDPSYEDIYNTIKANFRNNLTHGSMYSRRRPSGCRFLNLYAGSKIFTESRVLMKKLIDWVEEYGGDVIEVDTDGVYFTGLDMEESRDMVGELDYDVDVEYYEAGHFSAGKTYVLLDGERLKVKGASLWGRNIPMICTKAFKKAIRRGLERGGIDRKKAVSLLEEKIESDDGGLAKYIFRVTQRKPEEYKSEYRAERTRFFSKKYEDLPLGTSFDAVMVDKFDNVDLSLKPWATSKEEQWDCIVPIDEYEGEDLDVSWYEKKAKRILDRFIPPEDSGGGGGGSTSKRSVSGVTKGSAKEKKVKQKTLGGF